LVTFFKCQKTASQARRQQLQYTDLEARFDSQQPF
jgi:hypothetical protein